MLYWRYYVDHDGLFCAVCEQLGIEVSANSREELPRAINDMLEEEFGIEIAEMETVTIH